MPQFANNRILSAVLPPVLSTVLATVLAGALTAPALAGPTYDNASGGSFTFYGQFDPAYLSVDDGVSTSGDLVDNVNSNSRVGFYLRQPVGAAKFQFHFESALGFRGSSKLSQTTTPSWVNWDRTSLRHVDFSLSGDFGTLYAGQGSMAGDGIALSDLSGTGLVSTSSVPDTAGSFQFTTAAGALSGIKISNAFAAFDGDRMGRVRYDSPSLNGLVLSASYGTEILKANNDDDAYDVTLRYSRDMGDVAVRAALGVIWNDRVAGTDTRDTVGSLSLLHSSGLNGTVAFGSRDTTGSYGYVKLGYKADLFAVGATAISVDYYSGDDLASVGSSSESVGLGVVQKIDAAHLETYLGYRNYSFADTSGTSYNDVSSVLFGARWSF